MFFRGFPSGSAINILTLLGVLILEGRLKLMFLMSRFVEVKDRKHFGFRLSNTSGRAPRGLDRIDKLQTFLLVLAAFDPH